MYSCRPTRTRNSTTRWMSSSQSDEHPLPKSRVFSTKCLYMVSFPDIQWYHQCVPIFFRIGQFVLELLFFKKKVKFSSGTQLRVYKQPRSLRPLSCRPRKRTHAGTEFCTRKSMPHRTSPTPTSTAMGYDAKGTSAFLSTTLSCSVRAPTYTESISSRYSRYCQSRTSISTRTSATCSHATYDS